MIHSVERASMLAVYRRRLYSTILTIITWPNTRTLTAEALNVSVIFVVYSSHLIFFVLISVALSLQGNEYVR